MSKVDIGVGDEFPLDEPSGEDRRGRGHRRHGHHHGHHHGNPGMHRRRGRHGLGRLATLLVIGGLVALIVEHRLTADMAYGMIGLGIGLLVLTTLLRLVFHWRHHRRNDGQVA